MKTYTYGPNAYIDLVRSARSNQKTQVEAEFIDGFVIYFSQRADLLGSEGYHKDAEANLVRARNLRNLYSCDSAAQQ